MRLIYAVLAILVATPAASQTLDNLTPTAQVRYRFESSGKDFSSGTGLSNFNLLRTRAGLHYQASDDLVLFVLLQDSRTMGTENSTLADGSADSFDLREGFMRVSDFYWDNLDFTLGRMRVSYGEERLIGKVDWHNVGRSFDGGILTFNRKSFVADVYAFALVESLIVGDQGDLNMFGTNVDVFRKDGKTNQLYLVWQLADNASQLSRWTAGYYVSGDFRDVLYRSNGAFQGGKLTPDSTKLDIQAFMFTAELQYQAKKVRAKPGIGVGIDYLSGDDDLSDDKAKVFDTLYATNHKFYGFMDYFLVIPRDTFGRGLVGAWVRFLAQLGPVPTRLDLHTFRAAEDFVLTSGGKSKDFGFEVDLTFRHNYNEKLTFVFGGALFEPGDIFKEMRGTDTATWAYVMAIANL